MTIGLHGSINTYTYNNIRRDSKQKRQGKHNQNLYVLTDPEVSMIQDNLLRGYQSTSFVVNSSISVS